MIPPRDDAAGLHRRRSPLRLVRRRCRRCGTEDYRIPRRTASVYRCLECRAPLHGYTALGLVSLALGVAVLVAALVSWMLRA